MADETNLYGLMAEFEEPDEILAATKMAYQAGYRDIEAYSPYPIEGLPDAVGMHRTWLPWIILAFGIMGGIGGFFMLWFATVVSYPLNIGGRPLNSWPAYIPITFEMTVLSAATAALIGMIIANGLPEPYHPVFNVPAFQRASRDRFFLVIESKDARFSPEDTLNFLKGLPGVQSVEEVAP